MCIKAVVVYFFEQLLFDCYLLLTQQRRNKLENLGGSGIVKLIDVGNIYTREFRICI